MTQKIGSPVLAYAGWVFGWLSGMETMRADFLLATFYGIMGLASLSFVLRSRRRGPRVSIADSGRRSRPGAASAFRLGPTTVLVEQRFEVHDRDIGGTHRGDEAAKPRVSVV